MTVKVEYVVQRIGDNRWSDWDDLDTFKTQAEAVSSAQQRVVRPIRILKREVIESVLTVTEPIRHSEVKAVAER